MPRNQCSNGTESCALHVIRREIGLQVLHSIDRCKLQCSRLCRAVKIDLHTWAVVCRTGPHMFAGCVLLTLIKTVADKLIIAVLKNANWSSVNLLYVSKWFSCSSCCQSKVAPVLILCSFIWNETTMKPHQFHGIVRYCGNVCRCYVV